MEKTTFSWLKIIPTIKALFAQDVYEGLINLHNELRTHQMQGFELELVGRLLKDLHLNDSINLPKCRIAILSNYTSEPIASAARVAALIEGYFAEIYEAPFNAYQQEILAIDSDLYIFQPDVVLIAVSVTEIDNFLIALKSDETVEQKLEQHVEHWMELWSLLATRLKKPILQHIYEIPEEEFLGLAERLTNWSAFRFTELLNYKLINSAPSYVKWIDVDRLAARVGRQNWHDVKLYHHGKFGFAPRFLPEYTLLLLSTLRSTLGKTKKALILDLDNTLWGGIIGDDGVDGIRLGLATAEGEAYLAFCNYVKALGQRGVILGICSKNEFSIATEVFENHPHMPLKLEDFAIIRCNWKDKAANLIEISKELNIDISSIVFADDNRAECELVRQYCPEITTIHMNVEPSLFIRKIDSQHLFDTSNFSLEDLNRTKSYKARAQAMRLCSKSSNLEDYLLSLEMKANIFKATLKELPRLAQMELKTNQFNLATHRLNEEQLQSMILAINKCVFAITMSDKFTDHGLVAYVATKTVENKLIITDWLMSCRVFSRTLEHLTFNYLIKYAIKNNTHIIQTTFNPTTKNKVMIGLFESFGFSSIGHLPEGPWQYMVNPNKAPLQSFIVLSLPEHLKIDNTCSYIMENL